MDFKNIIFSALTAVCVSALVFVSLPGKTIVQNIQGEPSVGASASSQDTYSYQWFRGGLATGGSYATTSTAATYTVTAGTLKEANVILWTPNVNTTLSLTATSTHALVPKVGDVANVYLRNASSTAGATITLAAANANVDLQMAEATGGDLVLSGLDWAKLTIIRTSNYLVTIIFDEMTEAD